MPIYEYRCPFGHINSFSMTISEYERELEGEHIECADCYLNYNTSSPLYRIFSFRPTPILHEHFNHSTGQLVSSKRQHADQLKAASDAATARTGIEHRFVPHDPRDTSTIGVDEQGLESTHRARRNAGLDSGPTIL